MAWAPHARNLCYIQCRCFGDSSFGMAADQLATEEQQKESLPKRTDKAESKTENGSLMVVQKNTSILVGANGRRLGYGSWEEVNLLAAGGDQESGLMLSFRDAVKNEHQVDPNTAARFLRARKGHLEKTLKMFRAERAWRAAESVDEALTEPPPAVDDALRAGFNPILLNEKDKLGRPIVFASVGDLDVGALTKQGVTTQMLMRRTVRESERMRLAVEASAAPLAGHLLIQDIRHCTVGKFLRSTKFFSGQAKVSQDYYPELLGQLLCLRGPPAAAWAVSQAKRFLDKETGAKIRLEVGDPRAPLLELVDADVAEKIIGMLKP